MGKHKPAARSAPANRREVRTIRQWMEDHHPKLIGLWDWPRYRLFSRCWAQSCPVAGRLNVLHGPRQLRRCETTPMAVGITVRGWLLSRGLDPAVLDAWCQSRGIDPGAVLEPIPSFDPASVA
jgi:hypothetical protein